MSDSSVFDGLVKAVQDLWNRPVPVLLRGKVVSVDPVRVRLPLDVVAADVEPWVLGRPVAVGQSVLSISWAGFWAVVGDARLGSAAAKLTKTADQTYSASTWTQITFERTEAASFPSMVDGDDIVIPAGGPYLVGLSVSHPTSYESVRTRRATIAVNGSPDVGTSLVRQGIKADGVLYLSMTTLATLAAGDRVSGWFYSNAASNFGAQGRKYPTHLWVQKVG